MTLRIVLHREIPENLDLLRQWNDLVLQMERPEVFYTCEWALAMQHAYRNLLQPLLFLGYEGNDLVGVASLAREASENEVRFLAAPTADYCDFLSRSDRRTEFVSGVFDHLKTLKISSLVLANLPEDSATSDAVETASRISRFHCFRRPAYLCAQVALGSEHQREQLKASLVGKKKLRRYLREMEKDGPVSFKHLQTQAEIAAALPVFMDAHVARFTATHRVSSLSTPERRSFLQELTRRFRDTGAVTLSQLLIGDRPIAWNYGFQFQGSWFWYQPTFVSEQEQNSPGHVLLSRIVIEACDRKDMQFVDLGLGAEGYKERFANSTRQTLHVTISKSRIRHFRDVARYRMAERLKRSPKVESAMRRLLGR